MPRRVRADALRGALSPGARSFGLEIELNLTDDAGDPALVNAAALEAIADPNFQTELGQFNVEINVPPRLLEGEVFSELEHDARASLNDAEDTGADRRRAHDDHRDPADPRRARTSTPRSFSANPRYALLNEQIFAARGEDLEISIAGVERLSTHADTIAPEAACTSVQLHQQVEPEAFARYWNAAQAIAGVQVAVAANSPFFCGKELWRETRIALFEQATDTRPEELKIQGVRPRVWFGERWITSIFDLFEENVSYFPALLPVCDEEDPLETLERGDTPRLGELRLHNGTIYRWNRPIYDVVRDQPHLRVENRVLPAGPDGGRHHGQRRVLLRAAEGARRGGASRVVADVVLGRGGELPRGRARRDRRAPVLARARRGAGRRARASGGCCRSHARVSSAGGSTRATPTACSALSSAAACRCATAPRGRARCSTACTRTRGWTARDALREMTRRYREHMHSNEPVHAWPTRLAFAAWPTLHTPGSSAYRAAGVDYETLDAGKRNALNEALATSGLLAAPADGR